MRTPPCQAVRPHSPISQTRSPFDSPRAGVVTVVRDAARVRLTHLEDSGMRIVRWHRVALVFSPLLLVYSPCASETIRETPAPSTSPPIRQTADVHETRLDEA